MNPTDPVVNQDSFIPLIPNDHQPNDDHLFKKPYPIANPLKRTDSSTFQKFSLPSPLLYQNAQPQLYPIQVEPEQQPSFRAVIDRSSQPPQYRRDRPSEQYRRDRPSEQYRRDRPSEQYRHDRSRSPRRRDRSRSPRRDRSRSPRRYPSPRRQNSYRQKFEEDTVKINDLINRYKQLSYMILNCDYQINQILDEGIKINSSLFFSRLNKLQIRTIKKANHRVRQLKVNGRTRTWGIGDNNSRI